MKLSAFLGVLGGFLALTSQAAVVPHKLGPIEVEFTFGSAGVGNDTLTGTGLERHGAFGSQNWPLRYFNGGAGGTQVDGVYDIAFKNSGSSFVEEIDDHIPINGPATSTTYTTGKTFDGTALWIAHSQFLSGQAPAIGSSSAPTTGTRYNGASGTADTGVDIRPSTGSFVEVPVELGFHEVAYLLSAQVYMPNHDPDISGANRTNLRVQQYLDREGFGLTVPGGHGSRQVSFAGVADDWALLQILAEFAINGGSSPLSSDDSGTVTYTYWINGVQQGGVSLFTLDVTQMHLRNGPVRFGPGFGITRGWQGDGAEFFIDNIIIQEVIPEPSTVLLLLGGGALLWRSAHRRRCRGGGYIRK